MKFQLNLELGEDIVVQGIDPNRDLVILFPVTRIKEENLNKWKKILEISNQSKIAALVILDKTPEGEASKFFNDHFIFEQINLYLIRRPPDEPIYNSQGYITIKNSLLIIQLHDDDEWDGILQLPEKMDQKTLVTIAFQFKRKNPFKEVTWEESPPARINFTILPSVVWNRFTKFIRAQGGHVAGSMDSTLNLVARLICKNISLETFHYIYDESHWKRRYSAAKNLKKLADADGWTYLSGTDFQLLNRTLDGLSALNYFEDLIPKTARFEEQERYFRMLKLSTKRRLSLSTKILFHTLFIKFWRSMVYVIENKSLEKWLAISRENKNRDLLRMNFAESSNLSDLVEKVQALRKSKEFPKLETRFLFWEKHLK